MKLTLEAHNDSLKYDLDLDEKEADGKVIINATKSLLQVILDHTCAKTNVQPCPAPIAKETAQAPVQEEEKQEVATDAEQASVEEAKTEEETTTEQEKQETAAQEAPAAEQKQEETSEEEPAQEQTQEASQEQEAVQEVKAEPAQQEEKPKTNVVPMTKAQDKVEAPALTPVAPAQKDDRMTQIKEIVMRDPRKARKAKEMLSRFGAISVTNLSPEQFKVFVKEVQSA